MKTHLPKAILLLLLLFLAPGFTYAQETGEITYDGGKTETIPIDSEAGLKPFVEACVAAINARDFKAIKAMTHPKDVQAILAFLAHKPTGFKRDTLESMLLHDDPVPENHGPFNVKRYLTDSPAPLAGTMVWPERPTHMIQCSYEKPPHHFVTVVLDIVKQNNRWFLVGGVPDPNALETMFGNGTK